ncbi:DUF6932 family protein [Bradyrhizobium betae]|uniref:DUF6932 family protein n=1 Tax=Bradyrhizobium betae TaxID=244734 RepID=UPI003D67542B
MIPQFDPATGYLPPGEHFARWNEFALRFGGNPSRERLLIGLLRMAKNLAGAGCTFFLVDGSFVTDKDVPSDFDACCDFSGINVAKIDLTLFGSREEMKAEYYGELFPEHYMADDEYTFREFFQTDRDDVPKGVVRLDLKSLP